MANLTKECFIIGSGPSLLNLTSEEKDFLNSHPNTLAMNKYIIFYEKVGVIPKSIFLADFHYPTHKVYLEIIKSAKKLSSRPTFYVDKYYYKMFDSPLRYPLWNLKKRFFLILKKKFFAPFLAKYKPTIYFEHQFGKYGQFQWAKTLAEPLYWLHSSLTTAINLAFIIYPGCDIKLIGVDLNTSESFFEEEIKKRKDLLDKWYDFSKKSGKHAMAIVNKDGETLFTAILNIINELKKYKINLYCCNPNSLLVTEKICEFRNIIDK